MTDAGLKRVQPIKGLGQALEQQAAHQAAQLERARATVQSTLEQTRVKVHTGIETTKSTIQNGLQQALSATSIHLEKTKSKARELQEKGVALVKDPQFQTLTISTAGGAVTLGAVGGAFGAASGVVVGSAAGLLPALFTFGLSIPVGAAIGGGSGLFIGSALGGTTGGLAGFTTFKYRAVIKENVLIVKVKVGETTHKIYVELNRLTKKAKDEVVLRLEDAKTKVATVGEKTKKTVDEFAHAVQEKALEASTFAKIKAGEAFEVLTTTRAGVATTAAATSGAAGTVAGGTVGILAGAAVGVVPAIFTFGLSIPVGAAIGLCTGAAAGGTAGVVGGGAAGFGGFTYRKEIAATAEYVRATAQSSAAQVTERVKSLVRSGTGGTI